MTWDEGGRAAFIDAVYFSIDLNHIIGYYSLYSKKTRGSNLYYQRQDEEQRS